MYVVSGSRRKLIGLAHRQYEVIWHSYSKQVFQNEWKMQQQQSIDVQQNTKRTIQSSLGQSLHSSRKVCEARGSVDVDYSHGIKLVLTCTRPFRFIHVILKKMRVVWVRGYLFNFPCTMICVRKYSHEYLMLDFFYHVFCVLIISFRLYFKLTSIRHQ